MIRDVITVGFVSPPLAASEARQEAIHVTTSFWIAAPGLALLETLFLTELAIPIKGNRQIIRLGKLTLALS